MKNAMGHKLKLTAIALSVLLLLQLLWGGARLLLLSVPEPVLPANTVLRPGVVNYQLPIIAAGEIVARPLFWRGREAFAYVPTDGAEEEPVSTGGSIEGVKLLGVYTGDAPGVIVKLKGKRYRVSQGEKLEGWTLSQANTEGATFQNGGKSKTIDLQHAIPSASAGPKKPKRPSKTAKSGNTKGAASDK